MPRLGFKQYRVYDLPKVEEDVSQQIYQQPATVTVLKSRGTQVTTLPGGASLQFNTGKTLNIVSSGQGTGKTTFGMAQLYKYVSSQWIIDSILPPVPSKVKWLKPKHVTMLKLKGHKVEEL